MRAVVHDRHPVAELVGLLHVVRGQQDRLALVVQLAEDLPQARRLCGSRPAVGSSRNRIAGRCRIARATISRWAMPPESAHHRRLGPVGQAEPLEQLVGRRREPPWPPCRSSGRGSRGSPTTVSARSRVLVCGTTPISCLASAGCLTTSTPPTTPPGGGMTRVVSIPRGRLARAVGAEQPEDLPAKHRQVELVDGGAVQLTRIHLGQISSTDDGANAAVGVIRRRLVTIAGRRSRPVHSLQRGDNHRRGGVLLQDSCSPNP